MVLDNGERSIPVTAKPFDGFVSKGEGGMKYSVRKDGEQYILLETRSYFDRKKFDVTAGCTLRDDLKELECTGVRYPFFPYHPVLTIAS